tara:strand:+ start:2613 stop:3488 length:876 start_codon:yes stop_codon:yes gene_type:complete
MKLKNNKNIFCTVSAGYSSVMMALKIKEWYPNHEIIYAMANTSKEREESLQFMDECDKYFNLDISWIEAVINQERGKGTNFNVVDFDNLKRNGEIFEEGIKKYGIPSKINKWCNRELKLVPIKKFADEIFGAKNYSIAVGMRADEIDRVSKDYKHNNVFYPLMDNNLTTKDRNKFWKDKPIHIKIPAYKGNCDMCFEKSNRKLMTTIIEDPDKAIWWDNMINKYSKISIEGKDSYNHFAQNGGMNFYRENKTIQELIEMAKHPFSKATDEYVYQNDLFDLEGECGGGCKVF